MRVLRVLLLHGLHVLPVQGVLDQQLVEGLDLLVHLEVPGILSSISCLSLLRNPFH